MLNNSLRIFFSKFKKQNLLKNIQRKINLELDKTPEEIQHDLLIKKEEKEHRNRLMHSLLIKKIKTLKLEENLLQKQKIVIEPIRLRHALDELRFLHSKKEVPCYLEERGDHEPIHFIIHQLQAKTIGKLKDLHSRPIYIKLNNQEIRCLVQEFSFSKHLHFYFRVVFKRYIPGEPNETKLKFYFDDMAHFHLMSKNIVFNFPEIDIISYNDVNPAALKLDIYRLIRKQKYTFGDVHNILPPGIELHPKYSKMLKVPVATLQEFMSKKVQDIQWFDRKDERFIEKSEFDDEDLEEELLEGETKKKKKVTKPQSKKRIGNLKKALKSEQEKLRKLLEEEQRKN